MAKVVFVFLFSIVLVMSISTVIGTEAPESGVWSTVADKVGGVMSPADNDEDDKAATSPTGAAMEQMRRAAAPTMSSMRGAASAFASQASQAMDSAKHETATWGDWFKHKIGGMNIFGSGNNGAPAPAPTA